MKQTGRLTTVTAAVAIALAGPAIAQEEDVLTEVTVTGSRIAQAPGMFTPTPVTSVVAEELKTLAPANLIESLSTLPVFSANSNQNQSLGGQNSGGSNVNLHGAGTARARAAAARAGGIAARARGTATRTGGAATGTAAGGVIRRV